MDIYLIQLVTLVTLYQRSQSTAFRNEFHVCCWLFQCSQVLVINTKLLIDWSNTAHLGKTLLQRIRKVIICSALMQRSRMNGKKIKEANHDEPLLIICEDTKPIEICWGAPNSWTDLSH